MPNTTLAALSLQSSLDLCYNCGTTNLGNLKLRGSGHALRRATANFAIATPNVSLRESPPHLYVFVVTYIANLLVDLPACVVGAILRLVVQ